jgi:hypothetical protein
MLIEFPNIISVDKNPMVENVKLNIQPESHRLRLKAAYLNGEEKTPVDIVIFNWQPKLDRLALSIIIDGREMTTNTNFLLKLKYDVIKRHLTLSGNIGSETIKTNINTAKDFLEIPKHIISGLK